MGGSPFGTPYPAKHDVVSRHVIRNEVDLMKFGFVGLGQMGAPMAINLAQKHDVLVYDQNKTSFTNVMRSGAKGADNLGQFADVDVLITCLPTGNIVNSVLFEVLSDKA